MYVDLWRHSKHSKVIEYISCLFFADALKFSKQKMWTRSFYYGVSKLTASYSVIRERTSEFQIRFAQWDIFGNVLIIFSPIVRISLRLTPLASKLFNHCRLMIFWRILESRLFRSKIQAKIQLFRSSKNQGCSNYEHFVHKKYQKKSD